MTKIVVKGDQFICKGCGQTYKLRLPLTIPKVIRKGRLFQKLHKDCPDPVIEKHEARG